MKIFLHLLMIAMLSLVNIKPVFSAFLEGLEDVPLADGLKQIENGALSFGNEEIRLVEVFCSAENINFEKIKIFYNETLPQMGWKIKEQKKFHLIWEREGETLEINRESIDPQIIRLTVKSKN